MAPKRRSARSERAAVVRLWTNQANGPRRWTGTGASCSPPGTKASQVPRSLPGSNAITRSQPNSRQAASLVCARISWTDSSSSALSANRVKASRAAAPTSSSWLRWRARWRDTTSQTANAAAASTIPICRWGELIRSRLAGQLEGDAGEIVGDDGALEILLDARHQEVGQADRRLALQPGDGGAEPLLAERLALGGAGVDEAVGVEDEAIADLQVAPAGLVGGLRRGAERIAARHQRLEAALAEHVREVLPGVGEGQAAGRHI